MERVSILPLYHWLLPHSARVLQGLVGGGGSTCWRQDVGGWSSWRQGPGRGLIWAGGRGGGLSPADKPETMPGSRPLASSHHLHVGAIRALPGWAPAPVRLEAPLTTGGEYQRADDDRRWIRLYTTHQRHHHPSFDNLSKRLAWWRAGCMERIQGVNLHYSFASLSLKAFSLKEPESVLSQRLDRWTIGCWYRLQRIQIHVHHLYQRTSPLYPCNFYCLQHQSDQSVWLVYKTIIVLCHFQHHFFYA